MDYYTDFGNISDPPWDYLAGKGNLSTITDPSAPVNPNVVGRVRFTTGCCAGSGPARLETYVGPGRGTPPSGWTRWYVADWVKFDPTFRPDAGVQKLFEFYINAGTGGGNWVIVKADNGNGGNFPLMPRFTTAYVSSGLTSWGGMDFIQPGIWYQYEVIVNRSGRLQMWVRPQGGTPTVMYDGTPAGMGTPNGEFLFWWWGYGGLASYPGPTSYIYHNHIRVSYTP